MNRRIGESANRRNRSPFRIPQPVQGFTLIEVLLAIFIFAVVLSTIYASYTGTLKVINTTEAQAEVYRRARIAMARIMEDLQSAYYSGAAGSREEFVGKDIEITGARADRLRFISRAHLVFNTEGVEAGKAEIEYEVRPSEPGPGLALFRHDRPALAAAAAEGDPGLLLCDQLTEVRFGYFDAAGNEHESWDASDEDFAGQTPRDAIPRAVSVRLRFAGGPGHQQPYVFATRVVLPLGEASKIEN